MAIAKDQALLPYVLGRAERILSKVGRGPDCWLWQGATDTNGYGQISVNASRTMRAHRAMWMIRHRKPIPPGMTLDHRCRNRACVNPDHVEPVTAADNVRRGARAREGGASIRERMTSKGVTRYVVMFRHDVGGKIRQSTRTFGTRDEAEAFRQEFIDRRFTALPQSVWDRETAR